VCVQLGVSSAAPPPHGARRGQEPVLRGGIGEQSLALRLGARARRVDADAGAEDEVQPAPACGEARPPCWRRSGSCTQRGAGMALVLGHGHEGGLEGRRERQPVQRRELLRGCGEVHLPVKGALPFDAATACS